MATVAIADPTYTDPLPFGCVPRPTRRESRPRAARTDPTEGSSAEGGLLEDSSGELIIDTDTDGGPDEGPCGEREQERQQQQREEEEEEEEDGGALVIELGTPDATVELSEPDAAAGP